MLNTINRPTPPATLDTSTINRLTTYCHRFIAAALYCGLVCPPVDSEFWDLRDHLSQNWKGNLMLIALFLSGSMFGKITSSKNGYLYRGMMFLSRFDYWLSSQFFREFQIEPLQASKSNMPLITACLVMSSLCLQFSNFRGREGEDYHSHNLTAKQRLINLLRWKALQMVVTYVALDKFWEQAFQCIRNDLAVSDSCSTVPPYTPLSSYELNSVDSSNSCRAMDAQDDSDFGHCFGNGLTL